ncbi:MAG TPA: protoporphyrinogen oxidase [Pyrinomonadaceae bacterium]
MKRVIIIGGGITGLAAAHRILERSHESEKELDLILLEASNRLGGIVETRERDGFLLESGPDSFISEKLAALELTRRLGLESQLIETNKNHRRSFIVRKERLLPVPEGFHLLAPSRIWPFLRSDIFSWSGKARMALDLLLPRRKPATRPCRLEGDPLLSANGERVRETREDAIDDALEDESLAQFVRRRLGREALERMAQPMVGGIYTADPEQLSLRATMPRFLEMERDHRSLIRALRKQPKSLTSGSAARQDGSIDKNSTSQRRSPAESQYSGIPEGTSGARYGLFLSFDRGMQVLTDKLEESLSQSTIRLNTSVESLTPDHEEGDERPKWKVRTNRGETFVADSVCLALPAYISARLLSDVDAQLAAELDGISYASSATINIAYKREDIPHPLDGFGFVVPFIEGRSIIACTFSSVKFSGRAPQGHALLRAFMGGALQPEMFELSPQELTSRACADLRDLLGIEQAPLFTEVSKWERSMPQYHLGHLQRVKRIQQRVASLPGLALAGNAYTGLGIPDCIRSGEFAADVVYAV